MVSNQVQFIRMKLAEYKEELKRLDAEASAYIITITTAIDPYQEDVTTLRVSEARAAIRKLDEVVERMREVKVFMKRIEHDLG